MFLHLDRRRYPHHQSHHPQLHHQQHVGVRGACLGLRKTITENPPPQPQEYREPPPQPQEYIVNPSLGVSLDMEGNQLPVYHHQMVETRPVVRRRKGQALPRVSPSNVTTDIYADVGRMYGTPPAPRRKRKGGMTGRIPETRSKPVKMIMSRGVPADDPDAVEKSRALADEFRRSIEEAATKKAREDAVSRYNKEQSDKMLRQNFQREEVPYMLKSSSKPAPKKKKGGNKPSLASLQSVLNQLGYYI